MRPTIVLDPGHGASDPGAVYKGRRESDAALEVALTLKTLLAPAFTVKLTHIGNEPTDRLIPWPQRTNLPKETGAVAFVSLHFNSVDAGGLVFYAGETTAGAERSRALAVALDAAMPTSRRVASSVTAHAGWGRLFIDDVTTCPSVLIELDSINHAPPAGRLGRVARLGLVEPIAHVLIARFGGHP